ncbi:winged helix-turn-helix transcriptional regulator [Amycolatopsis anabasis]|uniref:winged helix-turn-helix transcriptional regulator n=1 Tax=Amycolatopsis anabasis TaxID=1840409 RepID=UPI00131C997B|nr:winged helix-turn-helix transcriptional regulator [Amycolatopsis anabasis]
MSRFDTQSSGRARPVAIGTTLPADHPGEEEQRTISDQVAALISVRCVVEVLDALTSGPGTYASLRQQTRARTTTLTVALRALAASGMVRRPRACGSWDEHDPPDTCYEPTDQGRHLARHLHRLDAWIELFEEDLSQADSGSCRHH